MSKIQKKRNEIEEKYTWDLSKIYETNEKWYQQLEEMEEEIKKVSSFKGKITESADKLLEYIEFSMTIERKLYKLYYYAHLKLDQDTTNTEYQKMKGKIDNLLAHYNELDAFANPELMKVDYSLIEKYFLEQPKLNDYKFTLEEIYRYKNHILSDKEETLISKFTNVLNNPEETFSSLTDSDMKFGFIKDENNEDVELTESNYKVYLESKNRQVRKQAFEQLLSVYGNFKNTISQTLKGNIEVLTTLAKIKNFKNSLQASLFNENVDEKVYNNLIETISDNLEVCYKYLDLKKEVLGLDEFHLYDQYVELVSNSSKEYSFEQGKQLVLDALSVLGEDYVEVLNKAFDERWIDVYNNVGKRTGAYSSGFYDTNPYILLNYENRINDVSTLAHELGHSMHTYFSCKNNPYQYSHYEIFVAEVASTVNELLLNYHILNKTDDIEEKKFILSNLMDLFKATIYRQVMFAEFEKNIHEKTEIGEILTYESLSDDYYKLNQKYFGPNVVIDEVIRYEWERIPHFYYNFYVYKYAIGLSCACYIVDGILSHKENALENYKKFLKLGGSDYPVNELKTAGIDITNKEVIESAIKMFDNVIEQFKSLI